ncbi:unnamed protein product [Camellia sinensis]
MGLAFQNLPSNAKPSSFFFYGYRIKWGSLDAGFAIVTKPNESVRLIVTTFIGVVFGFLIGASFPKLPLAKLNVPSSLLPSINLSYDEDKNSTFLNALSATKGNKNTSTEAKKLNNTGLMILMQIWVPSNPRGAEILPPAIVAAQSDFYLRRLWGLPSEDLTIKQKYLVTFTVGYDQRHNIDAAVKKFEWSKRAIHVSALKQTKWWYSKRFLYPDIVAPYDYIFIWDEDLGVEHFNAEEYIKLVRKHGLEISQPGLEPDWGLTWQMTKRRGDREAHKFVEIMAPVFSRDAWRCVWHLIQRAKQRRGRRLGKR